LGSPNDCINIYAGTRFEFTIIQQEEARSVLVNFNNNGILNPEKTGGGLGPGADYWTRALQPNQGVGLNPPFLTDDNDSPAGNAINGRAPLPPSFPGFVFGGTGRYQGIKGTFDLITVAQRTAFPKIAGTQSPTTSPTLTEETTGDRRARDLSQEEEVDNEEFDNEEVERELQRVNESDDESLNSGVIVQKIYITSNQRLPLGPKAV
jgi:hypothetical protein